MAEYTFCNDEFYKYLFENSIDMISVISRAGTRLFVSPAARSLLGYEPEELSGAALEDSIHPDDWPAVRRALAECTFEPIRLDYRLRRKDGSNVWVEGSVRRRGGADAAQIVISERNIDQRIALLARLSESEARFRLLTENSLDLVMMLDLDLRRTYVSPACRELFGFEPDELLGGRTGQMAHSEDSDDLSTLLRALIEGRLQRGSSVNRRRHRDGQWIWVETHYRALRDERTGRTTGIVATVRDISTRKAIEDELAAAHRRMSVLAGEDWLTGLANRRAFEDALKRAVGRRDASRQCALVMIDVDHFKRFNDHYGHLAGDDCLKQIGAAIKESVNRRGDTAARYGGEEFAVLLPDTDEASALRLAHRICNAVRALRIRHEACFSGIVTVSAGVAATTTNDAEDLVRRADRALYRAKDEGRDKVLGEAEIVRLPALPEA